MPELAGRVVDAFEARVREQEERMLSPLAVRSYETRGRAREEEPCLVRTPFQRDRERIVDRVAYINHDIDDAVRYGLLSEDDLPREEIDLLGPTGSERIDALVHDLVETSEAAGDIRQSEEVGTAMLSLRSFMFERVY